MRVSKAHVLRLVSDLKEEGLSNPGSDGWTVVGSLWEGSKWAIDHALFEASESQTRSPMAFKGRGYFKCREDAMEALDLRIHQLYGRRRVKVEVR